MGTFYKEKYISQGSVTIKGINIPYVASVQNFPILGEDGEPDATMYAFSYERGDLDDFTGRPVLFAWNGGPGCASLFVHMGLLSPMRVKCGNGPDMPQTAPFTLVNNDNCLLDVCDVVAIDAIGTGYARLFKPEAKAKYADTQADALAFVSCMRQWLTAHKRWNSPLYIMGESYGTIRTAMVASDIFFNSSATTSGAPMHLSGIINLGSALNYGQDNFPIPDDVLNLPSIAAANWYWHPEGKGKLKQFVDSCQKFCYEEYLQALALGDELDEVRRQQVAETLSKYTGYPVDKLIQDHLTVDIMQYPARGMAEEGRSIGIYDARFALDKVKNPEKYDFFMDDASNACSMGAFTVGFNGIWKDKLGIENESEYIEMWNEVGSIWNFKTKCSPMECLENAMHRNPQLKVMFGMGYYDMLTTMGWVRYLVSHYDYPKDRLSLQYYESGHMPYLGDEQAMQLQEDIKAFIRK